MVQINSIPIYINICYLILISIYSFINFKTYKLITFIFGCIIIILGLYFFKTQSYKTLIIKTKWTLKSKYIFKKTSKASAKIWIISGLLNTCSLMIREKLLFLFIIILSYLIILIFPIILAYHYWNFYILEK